MKINIALFAADLARRIHEMALDSRENNEAVIANLLRVELEKPAAECLWLKPKMRPMERREWLKDYCRKNKITGDEDYFVIEKHAIALKASGFYAMTSVNVDIIHQLRKAAGKI